MAYDLTRCPQTETEFRDYFYALIGRQLGSSANDYVQVLTDSYPWQDTWLMIPAGVGPGVRQPPDAPFFGLTQQYSGEPKARVFLPSSTPDELGYYTRCLQYVDDAAGTYQASKKAPTPKSTGLIWAWYLAGPDNAYTPVQGPDAGTGTPPSSGLTEAEVQALIDAAVAPLVAQIAALETQVAAPMRAHGPVNLPIVMDSLTSLRCKGDIDVAVKPGTATPPAETGGGGPSEAATLVLLKKLLGRPDAPEATTKGRT